MPRSVSFALFLLWIVCLAPRGIAAERVLLSEAPEVWSWAKREWEQPKTFQARWREEAGVPHLLVRATAPAWDTTVNRTLTLAAPAAKVFFAGDIRTEDVRPGAESFMAARAQLRFLDTDGKMLGGWPKGEILQGSHDWSSFSQEHQAPEGTVAISITLGLVNATGLVEYKHLTLRVLDAEGRDMELRIPETEVVTDTKGWWTFTPPTETENASRVDLGLLLGNRPIAPGDFVRTEGEGIYIGETPVRFWGTNLSPPHTWPDYNEGRRMARRLAREGINLVRFHHMDRGWNPDNLFLAGVPHTQAFDSAKLDRMDHFIAELRQQGIYVSMDLLVTRRFREGDGVAEPEQLEFGAKIAAHFNPRIIELQKDYARRLLGHRNPYTGLRYADDPALAFVSIINESNLFLSGAISSYNRLPQSYLAELTELFQADRLARGLEKAEGELLNWFKDRHPDLGDFLHRTQDAYFSEMAAFLRDELGVRALLGGSNFIENMADLRSNATLDVVDVHSYWDHPTGGWSVTDGIRNERMSASLLRGDNPVLHIAHRRAQGRPLAISEWQACWPNDFIIEFPLLMGIVGTQQGWNAPMWFGVAGEAFGDKMSGVFSTDNKPHARVAGSVAALMFRRGDFQPLPPLLQNFSDRGTWDSLKNTLDPSQLFRHRLSWSDAPADTVSPPLAQQEVTLHEPGFLLLNAPRVRGALGNLSALPAAIDGFGLETKMPFAAVLAVSLDAEPLENSKRILVYAAARAENSGQRFRPFRGGLTAIGEAPILVEPVSGILRLPLSSTSAWQLQPLDANGVPQGEALPLPEVQNGSLSIPLNAAPALWFELTPRMD